MLLLKLGRWQSSLDCDISNFSDTLQVQLTRLASMPDCQPEQNFLNHQVNVLASTAHSLLTKQMFLVTSVLLWSNLNSKIVHSWLGFRSSVQLSNFTWREAILNESTHQVAWYYQPQWVPSTFWTTLVIWNRIEWVLISTTWRLIFVYLSYLRNKTHCHNYERMECTIRTLVAKEMYYRLTFPHAKQYKTIHNELTIKYLLSEQTQ